jgi:hypothetical protein
MFFFLLYPAVIGIFVTVSDDVIIFGGTWNSMSDGGKSCFPGVQAMQSRMNHIACIDTAATAAAAGITTANTTAITTAITATTTAAAAAAAAAAATATATTTTTTSAAAVVVTRVWL